MGSIAEATAAVLDWLERAGVPAHLAGAAGDDAGAPGRHDTGTPSPHLRVRPLALLPEQRTRGGPEPEPLRLRVRYLITAAGAADDPTGPLDRVLVAAAQDAAFPLSVEPIAAETWLSLGLAAQPGVLVDMPVRIERAVPAAPRVRFPLRLQDVALRPFVGQLLAPGSVPLPDIRVEAAGSGAYTFTDARGAFAFAGLPAGHTVRLLLSGKGLRLTTDVVVSGSEPVVIHCHTEEV